jgi:hypothetical protein
MKDASFLLEKVEYFLDKFGIKKFMYANCEYDPSRNSSSYYTRPPVCSKHEE